MEQLLHYVWKHKIFPLKPLQTTSGQTVEVIDSGLWNRDSGPDFFNAKIKIDGVLWVGNVEIHKKASDWHNHHHDTNPEYDSVILHAASEIDYQAHRTNGEIIPQLELHYPDYLHDNYKELMNTIHYPACYKIIPSLPRILLHSWLNTMQMERFEEKTERIFNLLKLCNNNWEDVFFITLSRNFGFGTNSEAFELWAKSIPLRAVDKHRDNLFQIEAIFFGQAGLIPSAQSELSEQKENVITRRGEEKTASDDYTLRLCKEYEYLKHKFSLSAPDTCKWKLLRLRPGNFPYVRIAQLAYLYHNSQGLLSRILEAKDIDTLRKLLVTGTSEYWITHYIFGEKSAPLKKSLSKASTDILIINTVIPFLYAYGKYRASDILIKRATEFLEEIKPENNYIVRMWKECGLEAVHAGDSQALIQLKKNYCDTRKCLYCRIGYEFFKMEHR